MVTISRTNNHTSNVAVTVVVTEVATRQVGVEDSGVLLHLGVMVVTPTAEMVAEIISLDRCQWVRNNPSIFKTFRNTVIVNTEGLRPWY